MIWKNSFSLAVAEINNHPSCLVIQSEWQNIGGNCLTTDVDSGEGKNVGKYDKAKVPYPEGGIYSRSESVILLRYGGRYLLSISIHEMN